MKKLVLMLTALFTTFLCVGGSFTLSSSGEKNWQSPMYQIPAGRPPMQIHMKTITTGPIAHHIRIHWFDRNGKALGSFFPRPPFHYPEDSLLNKVVSRVQTVLPRFYPAGAEKFRIVISTSDYAGGVYRDSSAGRDRSAGDCVEFRWEDSGGPFRGWGALDLESAVPRILSGEVFPYRKGWRADSGGGNVFCDSSSAVQQCTGPSVPERGIYAGVSEFRRHGEAGTGGSCSSVRNQYDE